MTGPHPKEAQHSFGIFDAALEHGFACLFCFCVFAVKLSTTLFKMVATQYCPAVTSLKVNTLDRKPQASGVGELFRWHEVCANGMTPQGRAINEYFPIVEHGGTQYGPPASTSVAVDSHLSAALPVIVLPDNLLKEQSVIGAPPEAATADHGDVKREGAVDAERFPFFPNGRCDHKAHWNHLRAKRSHSYYFCSHCHVQWRQFRPKVLMANENKKCLRAL